MRGPRAGWGALTAPPSRPAPQLVSSRATPRPRRKVRCAGSLSLSTPAPLGGGDKRRQPATAAQDPQPASAAESRRGGRRPELPPPQPRAPPRRGGPRCTPGPRAAHPEAACIPGPGPAAPLLPSVRASVRAAAPGRLP